jgi:hypothetical protein
VSSLPETSQRLRFHPTWRRLALDYDVRLFVGQYDLFYGRTMLGLQVRLN